MRKRGPVTNKHRRTILLISMLACLCFSTGEGLRLLPIIAPVTVGMTAAGVDGTFASVNGASHYQYATCRVEKSGQKLTQRQLTRSGLPPSLNRTDSFPLRSNVISGAESVPYSSVAFISRSPGRAPPPV